MKYKIRDKSNNKFLSPSKYGITQYGDVICFENKLVILDGNDFEIIIENNNELILDELPLGYNIYRRANKTKYSDFIIWWKTKIKNYENRNY